MDNKYKALSYVPPKSINIKQRFGKLTLATCASAEKAKPSVPPSTSSTAKKPLYTYKNPKNKDVRISDDSLLTDDESGEDGSPSGSERNKIINNILNSDDERADIENLVKDQGIIQGNAMSQFSEKLLLDDSDETNCNAIEMEMGKLEISLNPLTPLGNKLSTPLFSTNSDTIVSRLSSQLDRLELNKPKLIKPATPLNESPDISVTNISILTISSTISDDSETEENTDADEDADSDVIVLSSDEDENYDDRGSSESEIEKHVSTISPSTSDTLNTQTKQKLSDFFNNIPSPESERNNNIKEQEIVPETPEGPEFIPETPENLSLNDNANPEPEPEPIINTDSSIAKINSQVAADPNPNISKETAEDTHVSINISTKIQINIQISDLEKTRCESTEPSEPEQGESDKLPPQDNSSPVSDKTNSLVEKAPAVVEPNTNKFVGLNQTDLEIDEEMEGILNELYGTSWQTPQLLEKCLSTKKQARCKPMQTKITEQIDVADFSLFGKKINDELESTRLPEKNEENKDQQLAGRRLDFGEVRRRPRRQAALKTEKLLLKVCNPDTSDSESNSSCQNGSDSDLNFTVNINQNDIDSDDDGDEQEKENRRDHRIKKVLDHCEYTKKPSIKETTPLSYQLPVAQKLGNSKRKLFTPQNWSNENELPEEKTPPPKPNNSCEEELKHISDWLALQNKKLEQVKKHDLFAVPKPDGASSKTKNRVEPKSSAKNKPQSNAVVTPKSIKTKQAANGTTYGFIQSLDEKISLQYCDQEAVKYRENYNKTKVELSDKLYNLYNEKIFNFPEKLDLTWNKKLLTTAGRCLTKRKNGVRTCRVELSEKVLTTADRLRCTLVHELCHAANWLFDGENGHGQKWKAWASKANNIFPELPRIGVRHNYEIEYKYVYMCLNCNAKQPAHSKSIKVDTKCCKFCHGKIQVFLNKKTKDGTIVPTPIREAGGFAKYVQENYKTFKNTKLKHGDIMRVLGNKFRELGLNKE